MRLLVATHNAGKAREFAEMLATHANAGDGAVKGAVQDAEICYLASFPDITEVDETGHTFRANACLKATGYARQTHLWTIADDSGLEVDALDGSPGVYSARWAQRHDAGKGDDANNALLLEQLRAVGDADRSARFVCVLALADPQGRIILTARETMEGRILREPRGGNGFGYDPLFEIQALGRSTAELSPQQKHAASHRGKALRTLKAMMAGHWPPQNR